MSSEPYPGVDHGADVRRGTDDSVLPDASPGTDHFVQPDGPLPPDHGHERDDGDVDEDEYGYGDHRGGRPGRLTGFRGRPAQPGVRWGVARSAALVFLGVALAVGAALFLVRSSEPSAAAVSVQLGSDAARVPASAEADESSEAESLESSQGDDRAAAPPVNQAASPSGPASGSSDQGTGAGSTGDGGSGGRGTAEGGTVVVYVTGAVSTPGVVTMPAGTRLFEILERVGGPAPDADLEGINLAGVPADGQHLHVLAVGEVPRSPSDVPVPGSPDIPDAAHDHAEVVPDNLTGTSSSGGVIDINTATLAEVESLPRVGPVLGQRIIEWRETNGPFARSADIDAVPGIGPAMLEGILPLITVR